MRHRLWVIVSFALLAAGAVGLLFPAFVEGEGHQGFTEIFVSLFEPEATQRFAMRWIAFIGILAAIYVFTIDRLYRRSPLTVVRTKIEINFSDATGTRVETNTEQYIRANRTGVAAYYSNHRPSSENGRVPRNEIAHSVHCDSCHIDNEVEMFGNEKSGYEILQMFKPALPYSWYMPFIPIAFINYDYTSLPKFIQKNVVIRRSRIIWIDEYSVIDPDITFQALNYSQRNVEFRMNFFAFIPDTLKVRRIQNTGVLEIRPEIDLGRKFVSFRIHNLLNEKILITWRN